MKHKGLRYLPYILVNDKDEFIEEANWLYFEEENWKDSYFKRSLDDNRLKLKPVSIEDLDFIYSDTIYYVYQLDGAGSAFMVWAAHKKDLKIMFPDTEIFKTKFNCYFRMSYQQPQSYTLRDGENEEIVLSGTKSNWKERVLNEKKCSEKAKIIPLDLDVHLKQEAEELEKIEKDWRKSLGGKSVLEHLADIVSAKKAMEEDPEIEAIEGITRADVGLEDSEPINNIKDSDFDEDNEQINNADDLPF